MIFNSNNKELTLVPIGGLGNRMLAITSSINYCLRKDFNLKILWFRDWGMGANFQDLFNISDSLNNVKVIDAKWYHYIYDRPRKRNLWLPGIIQRCLFDNLIYEKRIYDNGGSGPIPKWLDESVNPYLVYWGEIPGYECLFDMLEPSKPNLQKIDERISCLKKGKTIGVHIRRTDNIVSIKNSPLSLFIKKMEKEIDKDPDIMFYLASDSEKEKNTLVKHFGERIFTVNNKVERGSVDGIVEALVELYSLASTIKILGSKGSSYSILASRLKGIPLEIVEVNK